MHRLIKKNLTVVILSVIFLLALTLRFYQLQNFPVGFQIDEAVLGYNGYSFFKTGMDESGKRFPLYLDTFGDQNPIGYHVMTIIPVAIFGISEFATRFPAALFGALTIFPLFFLANLLLKDKRAALVASFFLAISPWSINLSRGSSEALTSIFFVVSGFLLLLLGIKNKKAWYFYASLPVFLLSFLVYPSPRVFVPLMVFALLIYFYKEFLKLKKLGVHFIILLSLVSLAVLLLVFIAPGGTNRFQQTSIFNFPEVRLVLEEQIREDGSVGITPVVARTFHNKAINYGLSFVNNYFSYFSGQFLFIKGGLPMLTVIPQMGLLYIVELPFILYGVYRIFAKKEKWGGVIILWLLIAPVTASLTVDDTPNVRRAVLMVPALTMLCAYGIISFLYPRPGRIKKIIIGIFAVLLIFNVCYFLHQFFIHGKTHRTWYRNNGFSKMMQVVNENYEESDKVILTKTGGGYPLVLFYSKYDPSVYISEGSPKDRDYKGFGKYIFTPQECPSIDTSVPVEIDERVIYVDRGTCPVNKGLLNRVDIFREDNSLGFRVYIREAGQEIEISE